MNAIVSKLKEWWNQGLLTVKILFRERSVSWKVRSALFPVPQSKLQSLWEEFFPKSSRRRYMPVWWDVIFYESSTIRFQEATSAHSYIEYERHWKCRSKFASILFAIAKQSMLEEQYRWEAILSECKQYQTNPKHWDSYLRFPLFRKKLIKAMRFATGYSILWIKKIPFQKAQEFYTGMAIPASYQKSQVKLAILHCNLNHAEYALFQEDYQSNPSQVWLRDYFLEVQSQNNIQESRRYFLYVGSEYSHREIENHCLPMKLHRKAIHLDLKIEFKNPKLNLKHETNTMDIESWEASSIRLNLGSRLFSLKKILKPTSDIANEKDIIYLIPEGYYNLDPNILDLIPIEP